jgi:hypothetical protein
MRANPRYLAVTIPNSTPVNLWTLLKAIDADTPRVAEYMQLEVDSAAMAALIYIGNSDLDIATDVWGVKLQAGQAHEIQDMASNLIQLDQIFLATDGADVLVGVAIITR